MTRIIAVSNPKGGVGKTTTTINLAASLAIAEQRVLIIDADPAGAVSSGLGLDEESIGAGLFEFFSGSVRFEETIHQLPHLELDLIPVNVFSSENETRLNELSKNRIRLKRQLDGMIEADRLPYDYVIIDTPPVLNDLTMGALMAANSVLIPLQCGYFALNAIGRLMQLIERVRKSANPDLEVEGIMLNLYERGTRVSMRSLYEAKMRYNPYVFRTVIPKNVAIGHATYQQKPVALVDITSPGARGYMNLAEEIIRKNRRAEELSARHRATIRTDFLSSKLGV